MKKHTEMVLYLILIGILALLDQVIKILVRSYLTSSSFVEIIPNFIHLTYQENRGISFSFLSNLPDMVRVPALAGVSFVVVAGIFIYLFIYWAKLVTVEKVGYSLILAGAIGNLIDRAFRQQVTDYMYFHFYDKSFFVNNLADDLISVGFVILILYSFLSRKTDEPEK
ncbi:MAG: signal peptidase II [Deltaproteobacteria bacterium]|nr:signal peptidase II [Deltaproteobacteria bacterium]